MRPFESSLNKTYFLVMEPNHIRTFNPTKLPTPHLTSLQREVQNQFLKNFSNFDLEIGCGNGFHPLTQALKNPTQGLIAIEHTASKFRSFWNRYLGNNQPTNLLPVHANAISWVSHFVSTPRIKKINFMYPNPNPKNPAQRWIRMPFFRNLLERLTPASDTNHGQIVFATNERWYHEELKKLGPLSWNLKVLDEREISLNKDSSFKARTHFEKKYLERGQTCYELIFQKDA